MARKAADEQPGAARSKRRRPISRVRSAEELAEVLQVGRNQIYAYLAAGQVQGAFRFGRRWIIPDSVFDRLLGGNITGKLDSTI
jgi:hypothetical protein